MKKGFTLIELLAVIVILAIIAVIAVPIVLNIINDAKESAVLRSADLYLDGLEKSIALSTLNNVKVQDGIHSIMEDGNLCIGTLNENTCDGEILKVEMDGEVPTRGTIKIKNGQIKKVDLTLSEKEVWTNLLTGKLEYKLAPGLYDENDKLIMSWDTLKTEYNDNLDITMGSFIDSIVEEDVLVKLVIGESEKSIGSYQFESCKKLTEIILPNTIESIGDAAFRDCPNLTSIIIPGSVEIIGSTSELALGAFIGSGLTIVIIEEGVETIGAHAFEACNDLISITIPDSVTRIGDYAFWECKNLKSITIPSSIKSTGNYTFAFSGLTTVIIEEGVESIGNKLFAECSNLTSITIPKSLISIGESAFDGCTSLKSITIPDSVTSISDLAFCGCSSLTNITIPNSVTSIGNGTFWGSGLTSITIPSSVTSIGVQTFNDCANLESIIVDSNNSVYDSRDNSNAIIKTETNTLMYGSNNTTIPSSIESIGREAFRGRPITTITIPDSVTSIDEGTFLNCDNLTTIYYKGTATGSPWSAPNATVVSNF